MICERATRLTVRDLRKWFGDGGIPDLSPVGITFTRTEAGFGGARTWFACPVCQRRCGVLYLVGPARWRCRVCAQGRYASETESPLDRLYRSARKLRRRLGQADGNMMLPFPGKPKGMHWSTYLRFRRIGIATEERILGMISASPRR